MTKAKSRAFQKRRIVDEFVNSEKTQFVTSRKQLDEAKLDEVLKRKLTAEEDI